MTPFESCQDLWR